MPGCTHFDEAVKKGHAWFAPRELKLYEAYLQGRDTLFEQTETALREAVGARPHWGLVNSMTEALAAQSYARWADWMEYYRDANQNGVFDGPMTDQLGISTRS